MKSRLVKTQNTITIDIDGKLNYEGQDPLKADLNHLVDQIQNGADTQVVFNLEDLKFVGSMGIGHFAETLREFSKRTDQKAKILSASNEFKRVLKALDEDNRLEFIDPSHNDSRQKISPKKIRGCSKS